MEESDKENRSLQIYRTNKSPRMTEVRRPTLEENERESKCTFRPMLLRKSLIIAEKLGDPFERLTK
jgi:hypothetical protein